MNMELKYVKLSTGSQGRKYEKYKGVAYVKH